MQSSSQSALPVFFDDKPISARPGDSVSAALLSADIVVNRYTRDARPRGLFCGMGVCADCLVIIDGKRSQRACMTTVTSGMRIQTQHDDTGFTDKKAPLSTIETASDSIEGTRQSVFDDVTDISSESSQIDPETVEVDLLVIGAGPAGLNAALEASRAGLCVQVVDERHESGGQYFKPRSIGSRAITQLDNQHARGLALRKKVSGSAVGLALGETVWFARRNESTKIFDLRTFSSVAQKRYRARAVVLATGAVEQPMIIPGWTLPGVMTIGAAQTLIRRYGVSPGQRVLVAGHGPLGMQLAYELTSQGATVVALLERSQPRLCFDLLRAAWHAPRLLIDAARFRLHLWRRRIPVLYDHELTHLGGDVRVSKAIATHLSSGTTRCFDLDAVCAGDGFAAQAELARLLGCTLQLESDDTHVVPVRASDGTTDVPGLWVAGDAGGLAGASAAEAQGRLAGWAVSRYCGVGDAHDEQASVSRPMAQGASKRTLDRALVFQKALWRLYRAKARALPEGDTFLCRCEEVTCDQVSAAIDNGAISLAAVKAATRLGMGRCQGRYCVPMALRLMAAQGRPVGIGSLFAPQVPVRPVPVSVLLYEKPEWSGHRESSPVARPTIPRCEPLARDHADVLIIGAGITGISAALYAAQSGANTICIDRGYANAEASGGNAGSLHLQLLSWDFGNKAAGDGSAALATLVLQQESIDLWRTLESQTNSDFEMQTTGGMMVAESASQIEFLQRKVAAENSVGINSEVIDATHIRQIIPAISQRMVAAAWCAGEGKINPLIATPALVNAAKAAGAVIEEQTAVTGITRTASGYSVQTPLGRIQTPRIIIAAGGWSAQIGAMLGTQIPVRGAPLQMIVTEPAPALVPCLLAHADRHLTLKQARAGSLLIGGAWTAETSPTGQARVIPESLEGNLWVAARTVPGVRNLNVLRSWAAMNIDIDGAPLLGPLPDQPGVVVAATANGYTLGPIMGREAAAMVLQAAVPSSLQRFGFDRFNSPLRALNT